jgi:hypothetical protein
MGLSLRGDERRSPQGAEAFVRQAEQLLRDGQIDQRGMDAAVTEVGREVGQLALGVDPLAVPLEHPMDDKGVAEIVDTWSTSTRSGLETRRADHPPEQL